MASFNKIMVAIDFSDYTDPIFEFAADLARSLGSDLMVASIINERDLNAVSSIVSMGYEVDGDHYVEGVSKQRRAKLQDLARKAQMDPQSVEIILRVGHPVRELLKIIVEKKVDMVVMGVKGRSDLREVLVGSAAEKVFRRSPVTVVSYRDPKHAERLRKRIR